jgi:hypothetical protein
MPSSHADHERMPLTIATTGLLAQARRSGRRAWHALAGHVRRKTIVWVTVGALLMLALACASPRPVQRTPMPSIATPVPTNAKAAYEEGLHRAATIKAAEDRPDPLSDPVTIDDPRLVDQIVSLLFRATPLPGVDSLATSHRLILYELGGEERAAASVTATPPVLRALGGVRPGELAILRYDLGSNRVYYYARPVPEPYWGMFEAPAELRDLLAAQLGGSGGTIKPWPVVFVQPRLSARPDWHAAPSDAGPLPAGLIGALQQMAPRVEVASADEAIDRDPDQLGWGMAVRDGGILITLGPIQRQRDGTVQVAAEWYVHTVDAGVCEYRLRRKGATWQVVEATMKWVA